ncbi:MAG TPA: hypothetical protein VFZ61_29275 [Polyangiales bacterium]
MSFLLGINMPWGAFAGHDFGLRPHGWGDARQDWGAIEAELCRLRALGVRVVRWFVLGAGVNYPCRTGPARALRADGRAPQAIDDYARRVPLARATPRAPGFVFEWATQPPPLSQEFLADFIALCRACTNAGVQLLPVLLSFEWFQPPVHKGKGVIAGGRARLVLGSGERRDLERPIEAFLDATLAPLLARTSASFGAPQPGLEHQHPIFAWESINEPDWVTAGGPRLWSAPRHALRAQATNALLDAFRRRVLAAGYAHSIGFKQLEPAWLDPTLRARLIADGPRYIHQTHHYPTWGAGPLLDRLLATDRRLPSRPAAFARCMLGEFPSGQGAARTPTNARWADPELARSERQHERYLHARLALIQARGFDGALLWSAQADDPDPRSAWDANTQRQLREFSEQPRISRT